MRRFRGGTRGRDRAKGRGTALRGLVAGDGKRYRAFGRLIARKRSRTERNLIELTEGSLGSQGSGNTQNRSLLDRVFWWCAIEGMALPREERIPVVPQRSHQQVNSWFRPQVVWGA